MLLYHFTCIEHLDAIKREGLSRGDVATSPTEGVNAVWLTTDPNPDGHGLSSGGELSAKERLAYFTCKGKPPPENARFANKRAVRITVRIPSRDRHLKHWPRWGRRRVDPALLKALDKTGGRKAHTWYLYFGTIAPTDFLAVEQLGNAHHDTRSLSLA